MQGKCYPLPSEVSSTSMHKPAWLASVSSLSRFGCDTLRKSMEYEAGLDEGAMLTLCMLAARRADRGVIARYLQERKKKKKKRAEKNCFSVDNLATWISRGHLLMAFLPFHVHPTRGGCRWQSS